MEFSQADRGFMQLALNLAQAAQESGEVPVGAVVVLGGQVIGQGWNMPIARADMTAHAEIEAMRQAASQVGNYRLTGAALYCTLEPCVMCAGAMVLARLERLVFAARDLRFGAIRSKFQLADSELLNHRLRVEEGLMGTEAGELLAAFFQRTRSDEKPSR